MVPWLAGAAWRRRHEAGQFDEVRLGLGLAAAATAAAVGLVLAAGLLVFGFFVGAALLGVAAIAGLIAWARLRWGKPIFPGRMPPTQQPPRQGETIIDAEYVVIRRDER